MERIRADGLFRGPAGPQGDQGNTGKSGGDGSAIDYAKLTLIILEKIKSDETFRGLRGKEGPAGEDGKNTTVVVRLVDGETGKIISETPPLSSKKGKREVEINISRYLREKEND